MAKEAVFTMKLEPELRADFMAAAEANHRPASQILREMMREYVRQQAQPTSYESFLQAKVDHARVQMATGHYRTNADVSAEFAARRAALLAQAKKAGT